MKEYMTVERLQEVIKTDEFEDTMKTNYLIVYDKFAELTKTYQNMIVTEDTLPLDKKNIASLRKVEKYLINKKREIKKHYLALAENDMDKIDKLSLMTAEAIDSILLQTEEFEEKKKKERMLFVDHIYEEQIKQLKITKQEAKAITKERCATCNWMAQSTSKAKIIRDITSYVEKVRREAEMILDTKSIFASEALNAYYSNGNIKQALQDIRVKKDAAKKELESQEQERKQKDEQRAEKEVQRLQNASKVIEKSNGQEQVFEQFEQYEKSLTIIAEFFDRDSAIKAAEEIKVILRKYQAQPTAMTLRDISRVG